MLNGIIVLLARAEEGSHQSVHISLVPQEYIFRPWYIRLQHGGIFEARRGFL
jgi:hypothetical protein